MPATPLPPLIFAPGAGAPTVGLGLLRYLLRRSTAPGANGVIGNSGAAGWHSHPGRVLLQRVRSSLICLCRSTALGVKGPNAGTPKSQTQKNRLKAGFSVSAERNQAAVARALMCAFRRLL